jgi:hypothetical protein
MGKTRKCYFRLAEIFTANDMKKSTKLNKGSAPAVTSRRRLHRKKINIGESMLRNRPVRLDQILEEVGIGRYKVRAMDFFAFCHREQEVIKKAQQRKAGARP